MKNENKYQFTNEQAKELETLRKFFDFLMKKTHPLLWKLINKNNLTQAQTTLMENELRAFDRIVLISRYGNMFLRMIDLIEAESNYSKQEFVKQMIKNEQYVILDCLKKQKGLREFFE